MDDNDSGLISYLEFSGMVREELLLMPKELPEKVLTAAWMALDGDGSEQDDAAAWELLKEAKLAARAGRVALNVLMDTGWAPCAAAAWVESAGAEAALAAVEEDADEAMRGMDRFTYFANGRP